MDNIFSFIKEHIIFSSVMTLLNLVMIFPIIIKLKMFFNKNTNEALGGRNQKQSIIKKTRILLNQSIEQYERSDNKFKFYTKEKAKIKSAGYKSKYAVLIYVLSKYVIPVMLFLLSYFIMDNYFISSLVYGIFIFIIVELTVFNAKRNMRTSFDRYIYKIYKYLHSQISSGVKTTDAIKSVYQIIEDKEVRSILILLAARYELTSDINYALEEFKTSVSNHEIDTLCIAIKQGVDTGENQTLLARQERKMFNKYLNCIQAETNRCKISSFITAAIFLSIVAIMVTVPLIDDFLSSIQTIFIN